MKLYAQADFEQNKRDKKQEMMRTLLFALPFLAGAAAAFLLRMEPLCMACCFLCGAVVILRWELRIGPAIHYGRFLEEMHSGLTKKTLGTLVRMSDDLVYQDHVYSREITVNIYEDMDEEGERRFLLDREKDIPHEWMGKDVVITSHGSFVLEAELHQGAEA